MRLGFGLLQFQGFPVCGAISVCHAHAVASPLLKPDVRISRIRLSQGRFVGRHAPKSIRLGQPTECSPPQETKQCRSRRELQATSPAPCKEIDRLHQQWNADHLARRSRNQKGKTTDFTDGHG